MSTPAMVTYPCLSHALPFRTILGEYRVRRNQDLALATAQFVLGKGKLPDDPEQVWTALDMALTRSEDAYRQLLAAKDLLDNIMREADETTEDYTARVELGQQQVLQCEHACKAADVPLKQILHAMNGSALCLSGGGIRSASFSLGVLQGLARFSRRGIGAEKPLLDNVDYLSTVSGGGYIGSWLMAWAKRSSFQGVVNQLAEPADTSGDPEAEPIRHLRAYTSYLTPHYGFTLDTLTLAAIVLRNMILNWLTIVPVIISLMCVPQLLWMFSYAWPLNAPTGGGWYQRVMIASLVCVAMAALFAAYRTTEASRRAAAARKAESELLLHRPIRSLREVWFFVLPLMVGSWLLGEVWQRGALHASRAAQFGELFRWMVPFALIPPFLMSLVRLRLLPQRVSPFRKHDGSGRIAWGRLSWSFVAPGLIAAQAAALLAFCSMFLRSELFQRHGQFVGSRIMLVLSLPLIWTVLMVAASFLSGLLSEIETEEEREWWARAGGLLFGYLVLWIGTTAASFFAQEVVRTVYGAFSILAFGTIAGYTASLAGWSSATANGLKKVKLEQLSKTGQWLAKHAAVAPVLSAIALICITFVLADFTDWLRFRVVHLLAPVGTIPFSHIVGMGWGATPLDANEVLRTEFLATLIVLGIAAALALLGNFFINVNTFSLHGMYRMRLTRAYLGASNFARHPDPFTNFDREDNLYEQEVPHSSSSTGSTAPLHVIGTALNLVGTRKLAWQQRKAESFTFSPVSCGSWRLGYRPTCDFGGSRGVRLGTAMAISGAAVSPNMGYHSSPLVTILMTLFNARLGWWLPNPIWPKLQNWDMESPQTKRYLHRNGPKWALMPMLNEALGRTNDRYRWIQLSDGGHFENLALYEMVMRRCNSIILVDADADCEYQFDDLGNAIRKIQIDLGIPITFPHYGKFVPMQSGVKESNVYCLEGVIGYGCVDSGFPDGRLIYLKPVLNGSEPPDIRAYRANHKAFPHEPTTNQFFNEAQFESYRHLGSWVIEAMTLLSSETGQGMDTLFKIASDYRVRQSAAAPVVTETVTTKTVTPGHTA
jgi:Patatin-like phospholipase